METLLKPFISAFGWSILNTLWQSALIYGLLLLILFCFPKMAARYKHNLAYGSIVAMFSCFIYSFSEHIWPYLSARSIDYNTQNMLFVPHLNDMPSDFSSKAEQYFPVIFIFYILGIFLQLFIIVKGYNKLHTFKQRGLRNVPEDWKVIFTGVLQQLGIRRIVTFKISNIVNVPLVIGYLKPVVLFPVALVNQLDNNQVEAILIHEISHIRRNDFLLNLIKTIIETLLFFNPFVWMTGRFIHLEREHACDDLVLKLSGKPLNYAHALLKLELLKDKSSPAYALAATGKNQNLYQRIKRITNMKTNYLNTKQQMAAITLGIACLFSLAWINPAVKKEHAVSKTTSNIKLVGPVQQVTQAFKKQNVVFTDTLKKTKIKIVTIDPKGNKTEYNSLKEVPDSIKRNLYSESPANTQGINIILDSLKLRQDTALLASIKKNVLTLAFMEKLTDIRKNAIESVQKYNLTEKNLNLIRQQRNNAILQKNEAEILRQKLKENIELMQSPEYQAMKKKFEQELEELKKQKGYKTDKTTLLMNNDIKVLTSLLPNITSANVKYIRIDDLPALKILPKLKGEEALEILLNVPSSKVIKPGADKEATVIK